MNVAAFIAKRIAFNRQKSFSRFIVRLATVATAISVAVMIMTLSFVTGFQEAVSQKIFGFWGHLRVQHYEQYKASIAEEEPIARNDSIVNLIKNIKGIRQVQAFATKYAILKSPEYIEGVLFKGVDSNYDFSGMQQFLAEGRWIQANDSSYSREIVLSEYTAQQLQIKVNDRILIYFFRGDKPPRPDRLTVVGLYKTGMEEYDKLYAIGDLKLVQRLNNWHRGDIGGYEIFVDDYHHMEELNDAIFNALPGEWSSKTIKEIYPNLFDWLKLQDINRDVVLGIMIIIAIINLITCLIIMVLERTRMIGVLKAVGASDWTVQKIFSIQGIIISVIGVAWGLIIGVGICLIQKQTGFIKFWDENAYYMSVVPVHIVWVQIITVVLVTLVICFLILLIPTLVSRKIQPAKAVQFR